MRVLISLGNDDVKHFLQTLSEPLEGRWRCWQEESAREIEIAVRPEDTAK